MFYFVRLMPASLLLIPDMDLTLSREANFPASCAAVIESRINNGHYSTAPNVSGICIGCVTKNRANAIGKS